MNNLDADVERYCGTCQDAEAGIPCGECVGHEKWTENHLIGLGRRNERRNCAGICYTIETELTTAQLTVGSGSSLGQLYSEKAKIATICARRIEGLP